MRRGLASSAGVVVGAGVLAVLVHLPFLLARPFFFADDFGCLADADNLVRGSSHFFELPAWGVWRLGQRALWWMEYRAFGLDPLPYHVVNVVFHALCVAALARLLVRFGVPAWRAFAGGALFAVLSAASNTVRYPSVSAVLVAGLAVLWSVLLWDRERPIAASVCFLAGACFYEQALCAPVAMLALDVVRRRPVRLSRFALPFAAAGAFVAINLLSLSGTTKVYAYNTGGGPALLQAGAAPLRAVSDGWNWPLLHPAAAAGGVLLLAAVGAAWRPLRGTALGLLLAWTATLPMLGRSVTWSDWYYYMPSAGAAAAVVLFLPATRAWVVPWLALFAWNLVGLQGPAADYVRQSHRYRDVTLAAAPSRDARAAVLVNVHSGLAWTAWQFGGFVRAFELWDAPDGVARCYAGADLDALRARMISEVPAARRRSRFPEDLPPAMRIARAPERHELFLWPQPKQDQ